MPAPETAPVDQFADVHPLIAAWIRQLLAPEVTTMVSLFGSDQIDVKLSAARGKARQRPTVVINGGPQAMLSPDEVSPRDT